MNTTASMPITRYFKPYLLRSILLSALTTMIMIPSTSAAAPAAGHLTVSEGFSAPLGFHDPRPDFSWKLPIDATVQSQSAYRVVVASRADLLPEQADLWDSGQVESGQSCWVRYEGPALGSRQRLFWQVRYWDQQGTASTWSELAPVEMGLLENRDWQARWIGLTESKPATKPLGKGDIILLRPQYLRKEFEVGGTVQSARLYVSAKGWFEAHLNGQRVGDDWLAPGWTPYGARIESLTYDVTSLVQDGANALAVTVTEGWHSGRFTGDVERWAPKPPPRLILQLEITRADGSIQRVCTDESWKGSLAGPVRFAGLYDGEIFDARMELPGWDKAEYDDSGWSVVEVDELDPAVQLAPKRHATVKLQHELPALAISEPVPGSPIFDLGQNMVGVPRLRIPVKQGQPVTIRFAEMLQPDGTLYTDSYRSALSTDTYIPSEDGVIDWHPSFTFHGFRYVELSGFDEALTPALDWVSGLVLYSDLDTTGIFSSSHPMLNRLQKNIIWGLRGNFLDVPTDCPQRDERLGWTGDAQVITPTSVFNLGANAFWSAWLQSMRESQFENGSIPFVVPDALQNGVHSTGWGDAAIIIPWEIYSRTGDVSVLEENYAMMQKLLGYYQTSAVDGIVDVYSFGDWLQPYPQRTEQPNRADTPKDLIGTAFYAYDILLTLKVAKVLSRGEDIAPLEALLRSVRDAFCAKFFDSNGKLTTPIETQTGYLLALAFELLPPELAEKSVPHLVEQIHVADDHLRTGFLGTPILPLVLDRFGQTGLMYEILFKETYPSWFFSINQGATTMWERWNSYSHAEGFGPVSMNSFNHYAYGAIGQWMYERVAGLAADPDVPGYKHFLIQPVPGGPLNNARAEHETPYGRAASGWEREGENLVIEAVVPPNTTATLRRPDGAPDTLLQPGEHRLVIPNYF